MNASPKVILRKKCVKEKFDEAEKLYEEVKKETKLVKQMISEQEELEHVRNVRKRTAGISRN